MGFIPPGWWAVVAGDDPSIEPNDLVEFFGSNTKKSLSMGEFLDFWGSLTWDEMKFYMFCSLD